MEPAGSVLTALPCLPRVCAPSPSQHRLKPARPGEVIAKFWGRGKHPGGQPRSPTTTAGSTRLSGAPHPPRGRRKKLPAGVSIWFLIKTPPALPVLRVGGGPGGAGGRQGAVQPPPGRRRAVSGCWGRSRCQEGRQTGRRGAFLALSRGSLLLAEELLEDGLVLGAGGAGGLLPQRVPGAPRPGHEGAAARPGHGRRLLPDVERHRVAAPSLPRLLGHGQRGDLLVGGCGREHGEAAGTPRALPEPGTGCRAQPPCGALGGGTRGGRCLLGGLGTQPMATTMPPG